MPVPAWRGWKSGPTGRCRARTRWIRVCRCGWSSGGRRTQDGGPDRLLHRLAREGVDRLPSRAAVGRALSRLGLVNAASRKQRTRTYRRWERGEPMELWQFDVVGGILLADGRELKAVTGIEDHSRLCVAVGLVTRASS